MERAGGAFFLAARRHDLNRVVISLVEQPQLTWPGRIAYVRAKEEQRRTELYAMDLVWLLAKARYQNFDKPTPSEIERREPVDTRSAQEIQNDLLKRLKESE